MIGIDGLYHRVKKTVCLLYSVAILSYVQAVVPTLGWAQAPSPPPPKIKVGVAEPPQRVFVINF